MIKEHDEMTGLGLNVWAHSEEPQRGVAQQRWLVSAASTYSGGVSVKFHGSGFTIEKAYKAAYAKFLEARPLLLEARARIEQKKAEKDAAREADRLRREANKIEKEARIGRDVLVDTSRMIANALHKNNMQRG